MHHTAGKIFGGATHPCSNAFQQCCTTLGQQRCQPVVRSVNRSGPSLCFTERLGLVHRFRVVLAEGVFESYSRKNRSVFVTVAVVVVIVVYCSHKGHTKTSQYRATGGQRSYRTNIVAAAMRRSSTVRAMPMSMLVATPMQKCGPCLCPPLHSQAIALSTQIPHPRALF